MKIPSLTVLLCAASLAMAHATTLGLTTLKLPVYLHGSDSDTTIQFVDVPYVAGGSSPEWWLHALGQPFVPPSDQFWKAKSDINVVTLYGIAVSGDVGNFDEDFVVILDATKAKVPDGYSFSIEQVTDAVATCVRLMYPDRPKGEGRLVIKVVPAHTGEGSATEVKPKSGAPD